jgi:hypothetical protein
MRRLLRRGAVLVPLVGVLILGRSMLAWAETGVTDQEIIIGTGMDLTGAVANWGGQHQGRHGSRLQSGQ